MLFAPMPETSVNKYGNSELHKNKVWVARQSSIVPTPSGDFVFLQQGNHKPLSGLIAFASDS